MSLEVQNPHPTKDGPPGAQNAPPGISQNRFNISDHFTESGSRQVGHPIGQAFLDGLVNRDLKFP